MPVDNEQVIRQACKIAEGRISKGRRGRRPDHAGYPSRGRSERRAGKSGRVGPSG